jgi:hypothetical protein
MHAEQKLSLEEKMYLEGQTRSGIVKGDWVKVIRKAKIKEGGWKNQWISVMDKCVGAYGQVQALHDQNGIHIHFPYTFDEDKGEDATWNLPFFILRKCTLATYKEEQAEFIKANGLIKGTQVRVRRQPIGHQLGPKERGWQYSWNETTMTPMIGKQTHIVDFGPEAIGLHCPGEGTYWFPYYILDKVPTESFTCYADIHKKSDIKSGDHVRVFREPEEGEGFWGDAYGWNEEKHRNIGGKVMLVTESNDQYGFALEGNYYPCFVLQKVESGKKQAWEANKEQYMKGHEASGLKPGDRVRVREAEDHENGWYYTAKTSTGKDRYVGTEQVIDEDNGWEGFWLGDPGDRTWFPYSALTKLDEPASEIEWLRIGGL